MIAKVPFVSIIIPLREGDSVEPWTLKSIQRQTWTRYETIITQGPGNACVNRNKGYDASIGDYLLFLDADIELDREYLETMLTALAEAPKAAYAYCRYERKGELTGYEGGGPWDPFKLMKANYISTMSLIRRRTYMGWNESLDRLQDWEMWLRMFKRGGYWGTFVDEVLFTAYYKPGDISTDQSNWNASVKRVNEELDKW